MLRVAKLDADGVNYYLGEAKDPGAGYYTEAGEPPGYWLGGGLGDFGLEARSLLDPADLRQLWTGHAPDGTPLFSEHQQRTRAAYDATLSAPKSLSVVWALADDKTKQGIEAAQAAAVQAVVDYFDEHVARGRQGAQGARQVRGAGLIAAAFPHRTSREEDPQLHTHLLIANLVRRPDGSWGSLDGRELYAHSKAAGNIYQAALREHTHKLGLRWEHADSKGLSEVVGVPEELRDGWSKRRKQVLAAAAEQASETGADPSTPEMRQAAATKSRKAKSHEHRTDQELRDRWAAEAAEHGWSWDKLKVATNRANPLTRRKKLGERLEQLREMDVLDALTAHNSSFTRREVIIELARRGTAVAKLDDEADRLLRGAVGLSPAVVLDDGETIPTRDREREQDVYTTPAVIKAEQKVVKAALDGLGTSTATTGKLALRATLKEFDTLSDEQEAMVRHLATSGNVIDLVSAPAGSGKTYSMNAYGRALARAGIPVIGCSTAAKAAAGLQEETGIPSDTIAKTLFDLDLGRAELPKGAVIIVDEAGMVGTHDLARLVAYACKVKGKVVLVGDAKQLQAVSAGGLFSSLQTDVPEAVIELTENRRQREEWEQKAALSVRDGDLDQAVEAYVEHERITVGDDSDSTAAALMRDYWEALDDPEVGSVVAMAYRRRDVAKLNAHAWDEAERRGLLKGKTVTVQSTADSDYLETTEVAWREGARIAMTDNDRTLGVLNGEMGVVAGFGRRNTAWNLTVRREDGSEYTRKSKYAAEPGEKVRYGKGGKHWGTAVKCEPRGLTEACVIVKLDDGREVRLSMDYLAKSAVYGWAFTTHKGQGMTVDKMLILGDGMRDRGALYVGMSRGRASNRLYVTANENSSLDDLTQHVRSIARDNDEVTATVTGEQLTDVTLEDLANRRRQLAEVLDQHERITDEQIATARAKFDVVTKRQDQLLRARLEVARFEPPGYFPERPTNPLRRRAWTKALVAVETYRGRWGVTDATEPLGEPPQGLAQAAERAEAQRQLDTLTGGHGPEHSHDTDEPDGHDLPPVAGLDL